SGLFLSAQESDFLKRMEVGMQEKTGLAKYCYDKCGLADTLSAYRRHLQPGHASKDAELPALFFECGSTIAFVIGYFALHLMHTLKKHATHRKSLPAGRATLLENSILSNNLYALTALAGLAHVVEPIAGNLNTKYAGFLPFRDACPTSARE